MTRALLSGTLLVTSAVLASGQTPGDSTLRTSLMAALRPALAYPDATADGLPVDGSTETEWSVRWPDGDDSGIEVLANPLHAGNRARALEAERQIQAAAMRAQQRSQGDYERALRDFARTGRTDEIREISLRDDGVAGDRFDAESQLTIDGQWLTGTIRLPVAGLSPPVVSPQPPPGMAALVRLEAHVAEETGPDGLPGMAQYVAEQAWVVVGAPARAVVSGDPGDQALTIDGVGSDGVRLLVRLRGNRALVEQVVTRADWVGLAAALQP
jgi:hypothetical protein